MLIINQRDNFAHISERNAKRGMNIINVLLEITVHSTAIIIAILIYKKLLSKYFSTTIKNIIWALLLIRLVLPITLCNACIIQNENMVAFEGWAIALWLLGALISLSHVLSLSLRLKRYISKTHNKTPDWVFNILEDCKLKLGIRKNIPLSVENSINSPALTTTLHPYILIPKHMVNEENEENLRFALLHELTHYKRRDHVTCLILLFLNALYWFNPILYFALKEIRKDMETACDYEVVKRLNINERQEYIFAILNLPSGNTQTLQVLGMSSSQSRIIAEKRIRAIYTKRKA